MKFYITTSHGLNKNPINFEVKILKVPNIISDRTLKLSPLSIINRYIQIWLCLNNLIKYLIKRKLFQQCTWA